MTISHDTSHQEFILTDPKTKEQVGELAYRLLGETRISIDHTFVEPEHEGQGWARKLLDAAVNFAREKKLKVTPACLYANAVMHQHKADFEDVL